MGHLVTQFQGQILRTAANNRVCGHASGCGYVPTSPTYVVPQPLTACNGAMYSNISSMFAIIAMAKGKK